MRKFGAYRTTATPRVHTHRGMHKRIHTLTHIYTHTTSHTNTHVPVSSCAKLLPQHHKPINSVKSENTTTKRESVQYKLKRIFIMNTELDLLKNQIL